MGDVFKGLADPARRAILELLAQQPLNVSQIAGRFEGLSRPAVSQHLAVLEECGLIKLYKAGRERYGYLNSAAFAELRDWLTRFDRLSAADADYGVLLTADHLSGLPPSAGLTQPTMLQAMLSRDERFKGRFYIAVKTTGIYCHVTCKASPKPENVLFFRTTDEAAKAGFRACKRCKP